MDIAGTKYHHETPFTGSSFETVGSYYVGERQFDPFGGEIPTTPPPSPIPDWIPMGNYQQTGNPLDLQGGCLEDGYPVECSIIAKRACIGNPRCMGDGLSKGLGYILAGFQWQGKQKGWKVRFENRHGRVFKDYYPIEKTQQMFSRLEGGETISPDFAYSSVNLHPQQQIKDVNVNCLDSLAAANQDYEAVKRALSYQTELENAVRNHRNVRGTENFRNAFPWQMLAAIGVRETGFQNRSEIGGGGGQGVFQITGANVSQEIIDSVEKSAGWILANRIEPSYVESHVRTLGQAVLWTLRNYNAGGGSAWGYSKSKELARSGNLNALDWDYGTAYPGMNTRNRDEADLKKGNYVSNVIRIATYCFGYNPGGHFSY
ncbi:MAG: hypothetical protein KF762_17310 [Acidobacteria bacterium]|nr:hypothetical protein [Acidobacteriota bacterium]